MSMSLLVLGVQNWTKYFKCGLSSAEQRDRITSFDLLVAVLEQPRKPAFFVTRAPLLAHVLLGVGNHLSIFCKAAFHLARSLYCSLELYLTQWRIRHFSLLNFMKFLPAHFSSLPRSLNPLAY